MPVEHEDTHDEDDTPPEYRFNKDAVRTPEYRQKQVLRINMLRESLKLLAEAKKTYSDANYKPNDFKDVCLLMKSKREERLADAKVNKILGEDAGKTVDIEGFLNGD